MGEGRAEPSYGDLEPEAADMGMKYYVFWFSSPYESEILSEFETKGKLLEFLNARSSREDFEFRIIHGSEVTAEPVEVVKQYRVKD